MKTPIDSRRALWTTAFAFVVTVVGTGCQRDASRTLKRLEKIRVGIVPTENARANDDNAKALEQYLSQRLHRPVTVDVGTSYLAVIVAMASGTADVGGLGAFSYVLAHDKYNADAVAMERVGNGAVGYRSLVIARKASSIRSVAMLRGRSLALSDPSSTSGNLVPRAMLLKGGLHVDDDLRVSTLSDHAAVLLAVVAGTVDAGAVSSVVFDRFAAEGKITADDLLILARSEEIPTGPIAVRRELAEEDKIAIADAFLSLDDPAVLDAIHASGFAPTTDSAYDSMRDVARALHLDLSRQ